MANVDFSLVNKKIEKKKGIEYVYKDREIIEKELDKLNRRHDEILKMSPNEFLSEEISTELNYIHERTAMLVKILLKIGI